MYEMLKVNVLDGPTPLLAYICRPVLVPEEVSFNVPVIAPLMLLNASPKGNVPMSVKPSE